MRIALAFVLATLLPTRGQTVLGPWVPVFKGIDYAMGTNTPGNGGFPDREVVNALRVDLTDPDIRLFTTPRCTNYVADGAGICGTEAAGLTTTNFIKNYGVQVAVNANNFHDPCTGDSPSYTLPQWTLFRVTGALVCTGQVVSVQEGAVDDATFLFSTNNQSRFVPTNWPPVSTAGSFTAVSGLYSVLVNGINIGSNYIGSSDFVHTINPRTGFGLSKDRRYLYMLTVDGRQPGYSDGAYDWELAAWLLRMGAWDGANMDGGGSTCMAMQDSTGIPIELNHDSAAASYGVERTVACHLGVFAKPLPGFINDVTPLPDDTAATVTWTTLNLASSQIQYGLTTNLGSFTTVLPTMVTNHAVLLTNLSPATPYYFQIIANTGTGQYVSSMFSFVTTNYVTTSLLFDLSNLWTYNWTNLDGINWTVPGYDDSGWDGGPGLLWVNASGPDPNIPVPMLTQMPGDPSTGFPYPTYYFRTHFSFTNSSDGITLLSTDYLDDGAVFYLNGTEIYRLRLPAFPAEISYTTLASGYACSNSVDSGNAVCPDSWSVSGDLITNLLIGDNVLAVEAHNYSARSPDITFGLALEYTVPYPANPQLNVFIADGMLILSWSRGGFTLQQAPSPTGPWSNVPGPIVSSPFSTSAAGASRFYRLQK